ncbi:unnamed protein product [Caenorhabditis auriculariae]|uniref:SHSP domain-containing protein n=1 Tax=Caenorhabditis auriculariae TaxID=2777116 RepID=A0A8S1GVT5_9PELO|nr:unnamed protein product [Caenorhabditis auriculariae]
MSIYPYFRSPISLFNEMMRDIARMERQMISPFSRALPRYDPEATSDTQVLNDSEKFALKLNVSDYKPEELKINLDGRQLTIEGVQEIKNDDGFSKRTFLRTVLLPEDVNLSEVVSSLSHDGHLSVEDCPSRSFGSKQRRKTVVR